MEKKAVAKHVCHDCKKEIKAKESCLLYKVDGKEFKKCEKCFEQNPQLCNFRETEVYSRVVGFLRPVKQWNKGKASEFKDRNEYANGCC